MGSVNSSPPEKRLPLRISLDEKFCVSMQISLKFVLKCPVNNKTNRRQAIISTNADPIHTHIFAALGEEWLKLLKYIPWRDGAIERGICSSRLY